MENPLKKFIEKTRPRIDSHELNNAELSQLMKDIDKVWMSDNMAEGGHELIKYLKNLPEHEAARELSSLLIPHLDLNLDGRLGTVGISVGELTPGRSTPTGVRGILRSGSPILLITNETPADFHRPIEVARAIGEMIYGHNNESVIKFVKAFDVDLALSGDVQPGAIGQ